MRSLDPARRTRTRALVGALTLGLLLAACSTSADPADPAPAPAASAGALSISDPWVKAADSGMTAAFGTLANTSDTDVHIVSATSAVSPVELHEMVPGDDGAMVMQQKPGGFVVAAGAQHVLAPGGDHLMLMKLSGPVLPGSELTIVLTVEDGSTLSFTAPVRSFSGANEDYHGDSATPMPSAPAMPGEGESDEADGHDG